METWHKLMEDLVVVGNVEFLLNVSLNVVMRGAVAIEA